MNLQVGAPVRCREEPSPSPPSRRCCFCPSRTYCLDVRGRRVPGYPTSVARRDIRAAMWSPDQGRGRLVLFVIVVDNPHKPVTLGGMAGRALAHRRVCSRPRWNCFCRGWLHSHWPLPGHSVIHGRCWTALVLVAAGVLETPSSIVCRRVYPSRMVHTGCQRHIHRAPVNISYLRYKGDKSSAKGYSIQ